VREYESLSLSELQDKFVTTRNHIQELLSEAKSSSLKSVEVQADLSLDIEALQEESIYQAFKISKLMNFSKVDLHLMFSDEAIDLLTHIIAVLKERGGEIEIITGRGNHSKKGRPVLFPKICEFLRKQGYHFYEANGNGMIVLKL